eukprot:19863-Chlamydomonas_euryale.AAC.1
MDAHMRSQLVGWSAQAVRRGEGPERRTTRGQDRAGRKGGSSQLQPVPLHKPAAYPATLLCLHAAVHAGPHPPTGCHPQFTPPPHAHLRMHAAVHALKTRARRRSTPTHRLSSTHLPLHART